MAQYEQKPGQGSIFKNDKKETDKHPDYKGSLMTPDGHECWVSMWVKRPEGKQPYFSLSIQAKEKQAVQASVVSPALPVSDDLEF